MAKVFSISRNKTGKNSFRLARASGLLTIMMSSGAFAVPCDFKNGEVFSNICGYIESGSAQIGGQLKIHVSTNTPNFDIHVRRAGNNDNPYLKSQSYSGGRNYGSSTNAYNGLNWGSAYSFDIPSNWTSGIYEVSMKNAYGNYPEFVTIKSNNPGSYSKVLVLDSLPTKIAYSPIGGKSMYGFNSTNGAAAHEVSMDRPTGRGQWTEHRDFAGWLDRQGIPYEAASMMDLHNDPNLLQHYNLVILIGHNEYWSKEMRDNWDAYLAAGGNGAIFSGNTMWWQVRFSADGKNMVCYKNGPSDPLYGVDDSRVTVNWFNHPVNRPENLSTGVSFRHGGYHNYDGHYMVNGYGDDGSNGGFKVVNASHWVFAGTGLSNGSVIGRNYGISGYEVDGALFRMVNGKPVVTSADGTPSNFEILATTPAYAIDSPSGIPGVVNNNHNNQGWGTLGLFKPSDNSGTVFVAPTIDWAEGLYDPQVSRITSNVINRLKNREESSTPSGSSDTDMEDSTADNTDDTNSGNDTSSSHNANTTAAGNGPQVVLQTKSSGGGGGIPLSTLLIGLLAGFGLMKRKR